MANIVVPLNEIESDARVRTQVVPPRAHFDGANFPIEARTFVQSGLEARYYQFAVPDYSSFSALDIFFFSVGGNPFGNITFMAEIAAVTPGDATRLDQKVFAGTTQASASPGADWRLTRCTITSMFLDGLTAGDFAWLKITRDQSDLGAGATVYMLGVAFKYVSV